MCFCQILFRKKSYLFLSTKPHIPTHFPQEKNKNKKSSTKKETGIPLLGMPQKLEFYLCAIFYAAHITIKRNEIISFEISRERVACEHNSGIFFSQLFCRQCNSRRLRVLFQLVYHIDRETHTNIIFLCRKFFRFFLYSNTPFLLIVTMNRIFYTYMNFPVCFYPVFSFSWFSIFCCSLFFIFIVEQFLLLFKFKFWIF